MLNGLSVDVEDWFQVGAFETVIDRADWSRLESRVERNTDAVLALFAESGAHATFFTLGWVAERCPALVRRIVAAGHEIASHGWDHRRVFTLDAAMFRADLSRARAVIEDAAGVAVTGYRAPSFSIDARTPWAHRVIAEAGYAYSSSVAPLAHDLAERWLSGRKHRTRASPGRRSARGCATIVGWGRWRASCAGWCRATNGGGSTPSSPRCPRSSQRHDDAAAVGAARRP